MTQIDKLISEYGRACLDAGDVSSRHGRTRKLRRHLKVRESVAGDLVVEARRALVAAINAAVKDLRVQHKAALLTYGRHSNACRCIDTLEPCSCGLEMLTAEDPLAG